MHPKRKIVGLSGGAGAGKDTFFSILNTLTPCKRFALADALKADMRERIRNDYGFDIFNCTFKQKNSVRPLLVAYGKQKRMETDGTYWTHKLQNLIEADAGDELVVITDIRYVVYPKDEYNWLTDTMGGKLVFIQNYTTDTGKKVFPPAINSDESENNNTLIQLTDYYVEWPIIKRSLTEDESVIKEALKPYVSEFFRWYSGQ